MQTFDLICTKHIDDVKDIEDCPPLGKSDHVVTKLKYSLLQVNFLVRKEKGNTTTRELLLSALNYYLIVLAGKES